MTRYCRAETTDRSKIRNSCARALAPGFLAAAIALLTPAILIGSLNTADAKKSADICS